MKRNKKNLGKRLLAAFMSVAMCLSITCTTVFASDGSEDTPEITSYSLADDNGAPDGDASGGDVTHVSIPGTDDENKDNVDDANDIENADDADDENKDDVDDASDIENADDADDKNKDDIDDASDIENADDADDENKDDVDDANDIENADDVDDENKDDVDDADDENKDDVDIDEKGSVSVVVDGAAGNVVYTDGAATVSVNGGDKTILKVTVDGVVVLDQSCVENKGDNLLQTWNHTFKDGKSHTVGVTLGYKLTVKTRYVNSEEVNGGWLPEGAPDSSDPTYYTLVVPEGEVENPIALLPRPSTDGMYPLRLLDYVGVTHSGFGWQDISCRYVSSFAPGSDDLNDWIEQGSTEAAANCRYVVLDKMIGKDAEIELRYNYSKICTFVGMAFETVEGGFVSEDYTNPDGPAHLSGYHSQDTLVDGKTPVSFDPSGTIFESSVNHPEGTTAENYALRGAILGTDHNSYSYQWINYYLWSEANNDMGAKYFQKETGLTFDPNTGKVDGVLINAIDARNIIMFYYWQLLRPVNYDANGGEGTMESYNAVKDETVTLADNSFTREGYTFTGWNTAEDGTGTAYTPGLSMAVGAVKDITLYAQWSLNEVPTDPVDPEPDPDPVPDPGPAPDPDPAPNPRPNPRATPDPVDPPVVDIPEEDPPLVDTPEEEPPVDIPEEEPPVDIPEEDPPLVDLPEEPPVDIPEEDPPLTDLPEADPPLVDVPETDVPLAPQPTKPSAPAKPAPASVTAGGVDIPEEAVPLANVPKTGDTAALWYTVALAALAGLAGLKLSEKKREH